MRTSSLAIVLTISLIAVHAASGAEIAIGGKAGTLGVGAELTVGFTPSVNARFGVNGFSYEDRRIADDIEYDAEATLRNATALLDWHPGGRGFRLSAGLLYNANEVEGTSLTPESGVYEIGDVRVPVELLGTLEGTIDFDTIAPYAGIGWGNAVAAGRSWGAFLDLGVVFQGEADVELEPVFAPGSPIPDIPGARELLDIELAKEERSIEEDLADYDLFPVVAIGFSYRF